MLVTNFENGNYYHQAAEEINKMKQPVVEPYIIIDYRIISKHIEHLFPDEIIHPNISPFLDFEERVKRMRPIVLCSLLNIANYSMPNKNISNELEFSKFLDEISHSSFNLFPQPGLML